MFFVVLIEIVNLGCTVRSLLHSLCFNTFHFTSKQYKIFIIKLPHLLLNATERKTLIRAYERFRFWLQRNSKSQARKNISYHYDLGNDFYGLWLDDTLTYSSGIFQTGQESLEAAQRAKYASMVDQLDVKPGDHVLEIGCGWGGFAEYAAKERGLRVTGLTISEEQFKYAKDRIASAGLSHMVDFKLQDYRDETGHYDGIASIEKFEAVGEKYWPA